MNRLQAQDLELTYASAGVHKKQSSADYTPVQERDSRHGAHARPHWKLGPLSFTIEEGERVGIIGDSGSGKSTLLQTIQHYGTPTLPYCMPQVEMAGTIQKPQAPLMMVMQESKSALNPIRTVRQCFKVIHKSKVSGRADPLRDDEIAYYLKLVGFEPIKDILHAKPYQLSGGMAQRVMTALVLAAGAKWVLADEVSASLDLASEEKIMQTLTSHVPSLIIVTHRLHIITRFCKRVIFLDNGSILFDGSIKNLFMSSHNKIKAYIDNLQLAHND